MWDKSVSALYKFCSHFVATTPKATCNEANAQWINDKRILILCHYYESHHVHNQLVAVDNRHFMHQHFNRWFRLTKKQNNKIQSTDLDIIEWKRACLRLLYLRVNYMGVLRLISVVSPKKVFDFIWHTEIKQYI